MSRQEIIHLRVSSNTLRSWATAAANEGIGLNEWLINTADRRVAMSTKQNSLKPKGFSASPEVAAKVQPEVRLTDEKFAGLVVLLGLQDKPTTRSARLVLLHGMSQVDAAKAEGVTKQATNRAVKHMIQMWMMVKGLTAS